MQNSLSVLFYVRKKGAGDLSMATIYLRITFDSKRAEVSTMRKIGLSKWNAKANKVIGYGLEARQTNRQLDIIKNRIYEIYQNFLSEDTDFVTAKRIRDEYIGVNKNRKLILELFDEHNLRMERLGGKNFLLERYKGIRLKKASCQIH